jgi:alpha-glucosidase
MLLPVTRLSTFRSKLYGLTSIVSLLCNIADLDMYLYRDWTLDPISFPPSEMAEFLDSVHANNQHWVPIHDAAIYRPNPNNASDALDYFTQGDSLDVWLLNPDLSTYIGDVWPGYTVFPDWLANNTQTWWTEGFRNFSQIANFDGIWLDMNEASSFCVGSCGSTNYTQNPVHPPFALPGEPGNVIYSYPEGFNLTNVTEAAAASSASSSQAAATATPTTTGTSSTASTTPTPNVNPLVENINYPPYAINHHQLPHDLAVHAVSPNATHHDGTVEYNIHNIFGYLETRATHNALTSIHPEARPFIITRSTFPGSGAIAGHWGGNPQFRRFSDFR